MIIVFSCFSYELLIFHIFFEQWIVNGEICIGLFALRNIKKVRLLLPVIIFMLAFCLESTLTYCINMLVAIFFLIFSICFKYPSARTYPKKKKNFFQKILQPWFIQ